MLGNAKVDPGQVFAAAWKDNSEFSTVGLKHAKTFTLSGSNLNGRKLQYAKNVGMIAMTAVNYVLGGQLVTGAQNGGLIRWNGSSAGKPIKTHTDAIWAIEQVDGQSFATGANDGKVILWNSNFQANKTFDIN